MLQMFLALDEKANATNLLIMYIRTPEVVMQFVAKHVKFIYDDYDQPTISIFSICQLIFLASIQSVLFMGAL